MKKNIAILTSSDFPYHGAPESFVRQMALGLSSNDMNVEVIRFWGDRYSNINDTDIKCANYLFKKPFKNSFIKFLEVLLQVLYTPLFICYRKIIKKDQIIILYGLDRAYIVFPLTLFSRLFKLKIYRIITEIYPSYQYAYTWWRKPLILFNDWQIKYFDRYLNGVVVLSRMLQDLELRNNVKKEKLILIPHFIDLNFQSLINYQSDKQKTRIGFCGNPSVENGVLDLIKAYLKLYDLYHEKVELIIIGNITADIKIEINKYLTGNEIIIFTGHLSKDEVAKELNLCDVLVNPRRAGILADSGFPTKIGEYFAAQKPVVATKVGDLQYYFSDKKELIFAEPNNPNSLYEALKFLISNKAVSTEIVNNGYAWARNNLDYIENSRRLISFINCEFDN